MSSRYATIGDRDANITIRGENVYPSEIDAALSKLASYGGEHRIIVSRDGTMDELGTSADPMSGFVNAYLKRYPDATDAELAQVMAYFPFGQTAADDKLPVLHGQYNVPHFDSKGAVDHVFTITNSGGTALTGAVALLRARRWRPRAVLLVVLLVLALRHNRHLQL